MAEIVQVHIAHGIIAVDVTASEAAGQLSRAADTPGDAIHAVRQAIKQGYSLSGYQHHPNAYADVVLIEPSAVLAYGYLQVNHVGTKIVPRKD